MYFFPLSLFLHAPRLMEDWQQGPFVDYLEGGHWGQFLGFWKCCCSALFAYQGVEIIGLAAAETGRPRDTLPHAVRRVSHRIIFYYVGAIFVLGLNVSAKDPILAFEVTSAARGFTSPFGLMVQRAGIPKLVNLINAVALIASVSVANANLYVAV
jgi:amino acid transporter